MRHLVPLFFVHLLGCAQVVVDDRPCESSPLPSAAAPEPTERPVSPPPEAPAPPSDRIDGTAVRAVYAWSYEPTPTPPWTFVGFHEPAWVTPDSGGSLVVPEVLAGDQLLVLARCVVESSHGPGALRIVALDDGDEQLVAEALVEPTSPDWRAVDLRGAWSAAAPGDYPIALQGTSTGSLYIQGAAHITIFHMRP